MKAKISIVIFTILVISACNKDQFTTKPQLKFTEVNTQELFPEQVIVFTMHYTDKEGDIQDSLFVQKITENCPASNFSDLYPLPPDVPQTKDAEGDIQVRYAYGLGLGFPQITNPPCDQNDTCVFRFALKDKAGNISDTISSPTVIIIKR